MTACLLCDSDRLHKVLSVSGTPALSNALWPTVEEARNAPLGTIDLVVCTDCGLIFNAAFDASLITYAPEYENSLHYSAAFQQFAEGLADRLITAHDLHNAAVADIGCGSGDFLAMLADRGDNHGVGYDPSHAPARRAGSNRITVHQRPLTGADRLDVQLVATRHVLEHLDDPRAFLDTMHAATAGTDPVLYAEVPDADYMLDAPAVWDLIYEHVSYFTAKTLEHVLRTCGFAPVRTDTAFGGQFLWTEARRTAQHGEQAVDAGAVATAVARADSLGTAISLVALMVPFVSVGRYQAAVKGSRE